MDKENGVVTTEVLKLLKTEYSKQIKGLYIYLLLCFCLLFLLLIAFIKDVE